MTNQNEKKTWIEPSLKIHGSFESITKSCKTLGRPGDGYYLGQKSNPLQACSS